MLQPLANFVQPGSQPIALPWWRRFHAVPDFAQAFAHAHTMLATAFPLLPVAATALPIARAITLPPRPLDVNVMAADGARFSCPCSGFNLTGQRARSKKAATEDGYETTTSSHDAPLSYVSTERTTERDTHSAFRATRRNDQRNPTVLTEPGI
jgi:hypothetical protein